MSKLLLLVDTSALIDLAAIDALDFLLQHTFYVPAEFLDIMSSADPAALLDVDGTKRAEYSITVRRLKAFLPHCKEVPIDKPLEVMQWCARLQPLRLDQGEHHLCFHVPRLPGSYLVTSDLRAVRRIMASSDEALKKHFHGRFICFEELLWYVLKWRNYEASKALFFSATWRRQSLRSAFFAKGPATDEAAFHGAIQKAAKGHHDGHHPFLTYSWLDA